MAKNFNELRAAMSPQRREANRREAEKMIAALEMPGAGLPPEGAGDGLRVARPAVAGWASPLKPEAAAQ